MERLFETLRCVFGFLYREFSRFLSSFSDFLVSLRPHIHLTTTNEGILATHATFCVAL